MASIRPSPTSPSTSVVGKGRLGVGVGLAVVLAVSWAYVLYMAWGMAHMDVAVEWLLMPRMSRWGGADLALVFVMWSLMMAAMMLPSAVPLLLLLHRTNLERFARRRAIVETGVFAIGYLTVWTGFSTLATFAQWSLLEARLVSPMMESSSTYLSGALLLAAGAYQFSALKNACLSSCRSPLSFLMSQRIHSAFLLGVRHGTYCTGCCWLLMTLLFVLGVMNVVWIVALTIVVLLERFLHRPRWFIDATGAALLLWGVLVLVQRVIGASVASAHFGN